MSKGQSIREGLRSQRPQTVMIKLPLDKSKPKSLLVSVNGERYAIERGKAVEVPYAVAQVIEQSAASDAALEERIRQMSENPNVQVM